MSIVVIFGLLVGSAVRIYPEMRIIRFLLSKLKIEEKAKIILTLFIALLVDATLLTIFKYSANQFVYLGLTDIATLIFFSYKDYTPNGSMNKVISHRLFKIIFGILFFFVMLSICMAFLPILGISDRYYIVTLSTSLIYCYFGFWRTKKTPEGVMSSM